MKIKLKLQNFDNLENNLPTGKDKKMERHLSLKTKIIYIYIDMKYRARRQLDISGEENVMKRELTHTCIWSHNNRATNKEIKSIVNFAKVS